MEALHLPARLGVLHGLEVGYIEKAPGHIPVTSFSPAARRPAHATGLGKALLAFAPADVLRRVGTASLPGFTPRTLTRPDQLHHALHRVRCDGRALDRGELSAHVRTVAVPVLGPGDIALAAVEVEVEDLSADTIATVTPGADARRARAHARAASVLAVERASSPHARALSEAVAPLGNCRTCCAGCGGHPRCATR